MTMPNDPTDPGALDPASAGGDEVFSNQEEAGLGEFSVPDEETGEEASYWTSLDPFLAVSPAMLETKRALEDQLQGQAAQAIGARSFDDLADAGSVQGVGLGLADAVSGGEPGSPALEVYVAERASADQVRSVIVGPLGVSAASSAEEVPIRPVVTGIIDAQPHRFRVRRAPGGVSAGHPQITAGTLGCLARGRTAPRSSRILVLSNNHVLADSNAGAFGDCISQPGRVDAGTCPADQIAILERFVPINFSGGANFVDCATGWAWSRRVRRELVYLSGGTPRYFRVASVPVAAAPGQSVGKSGRTTQLTRGQVSAIGVTVNVNYGQGRIAQFRDQISIQSGTGNFSLGGDSGSLIWAYNASRNPVGLLFAGGGGTTFANPIARVLAALNIDLYT